MNESVAAFTGLGPILEALPSYEDAAEELKETLLSNLIMIGEIPAPTFGEEARIHFLRDRFNECDLENCSIDQRGNGLAVLPGTEGGEKILVVAHADTIHDADINHSIYIQPDWVVGPGLGDNSLGLAALTTLPTLLEKLGIRLKRDLLLMGSTRSLGRGDLEGLRFFLSNNELPLAAGVCVEGVALGRLSYKSIGMIRSELTVSLPEEYDWTRFGVSSSINILNQVLNKINEIRRPNRPRSTIVLGSVRGGSSYSQMATTARLRFEVRSESGEQVKEIWTRLENIVAEVASDTGADIDLNEIARREPGGIDFGHPLVSSMREIMNALEVQHRVAPSTSELSALIDAGVPAVTIGLTQGRRLQKPEETLQISPMFTGLAQLVGVIRAIDEGCCDER